MCLGKIVALDIHILVITYGVTQKSCA